MLLPRLTRRRLAGCALLALAALAGGAWWLLTDRPGRVTRVNFDHLVIETRYGGRLFPGVRGMALSEVVSLLGPYRSDWTMNPNEDQVQYVWEGFDAIVYVVFEHGRAQSKSWQPLDWTAYQRVQRLWYWTRRRR
jgi:hypothetical protein